MKRFRVIFVSLFIYTLPFRQSAQVYDDLISGEVWTPLEASVESGFLQFVDDDRYIGEILDEIHYILSGMIFGFSFEYTPSDLARGIDEIFTVAPVAQITRGNPSLKITEASIEGNRYTVRFRYTLGPDEIRWKKRLQSNDIPLAAGIGEGNYMAGFEGKKEALNESVKESVRSYLRPIVYNKPRRITGELILAELPYTVVKAGKFMTSIRIFLKIEKIEPYAVY